MDQDYSIRELSQEEFKPLFDANKNSVFEDVHSYNLRDILSNMELKQTEDREKGVGQQYKLHLGVFDGDNKFVGWSWGQQENASTFYMVNSAILPAHRRKGLYSALLGCYIETLSQKGFS